MARKGRLALCCVLVGLGLVGVGGVGDTVDEASSPFIRLLSVLPDTEDTRGYLQLNDVARAADVLAEVGQFPRPDENADIESVQQYAVFLLTRLKMIGGPYVSGLDEYGLRTLETLRVNAGYDARDVDATILGGNPPDQLGAMTLRLPSQTVHDHLLNRAEIPSPQQDEHLGTPVLAWGEDGRVNFNRRLIPPAFDALGRGAKLGFRADGLILSTLYRKSLNAMIEAADGRSASLANVDDYRLIAEALASLEAYSAVALNQTQSLDVIRPPFSTEPFDLILLKPYRVYGSSIGRTDGRFHAGIVLVHEGNASASINVDRLREKLATESSIRTETPWRAVFDVDAAEIHAEGRVLIARLPFVNSEPSFVWSDVVFARDPLLVHE